MANSDNGIAVAEQVLRSIANEYHWKSGAPSGAFGTLMLVAKLKGADAALQKYAELKTQPGKVDEGVLNGIGYTLLFSGKEQDAIKILKRNAEEYPKSSNAYDSLGEAYAKLGQKERAMESYEKALELDPKNQNAASQLRKLKERK